MNKRYIWGICLLVSSTAQAVYAGDVTWRDNVQPIFDRRCVACHDDSAPEYQRYKLEKAVWSAKGIGMRMNTYSHLVSFVGWPNSGALMRRLDDGRNTADKRPGNMYQYLGDTEEERQVNLSVFKQWVGNWNLKRWSDVVKDDVTGLQVKY